MMPSFLAPMADDMVSSFAKVVEQDDAASTLPDLLTAEEHIKECMREVGHRMLQAYLDTRLKQAKAARPACPICGQQMELLQQTEWTQGSSLGDVRVKDVYVYCRPCRSSARPLHEWLGTGPERWSLCVQREVVDLASDESCQKAVDKLERLHPGLEVGRTTALRMLHEHGERAREFVVEKITSALAMAGKEGEREGIVELEVEFDGGMIPVATLEPITVEEGKKPELTPVRHLPKRRKDCRWVEVKLGLVQVPGEVEGRLYTARPTDELVEVFMDLLGLAWIKGWSEKTQVRGIADGARHIRPHMEEIFHACPFCFILDRPHAKEHLTAAGERLQSLGLIAIPVAEWAKTSLDLLEQGKAAVVVDELRTAARRAANRMLELGQITLAEIAKAIAKGKTKEQALMDDVLRREADYFERNQDAVEYAKYRENGWSTASSEIESGHRSVVQVRLKLPGTWWHPDNVPKILALRMLKVNGWWDEYWARERLRWAEKAEELKRSARYQAAA